MYPNSKRSFFFNSSIPKSLLALGICVQWYTLVQYRDITAGKYSPQNRISSIIPLYQNVRNRKSRKLYEARLVEQLLLLCWLYRGGRVWLGERKAAQNLFGGGKVAQNSFSHNVRLSNSWTSLFHILLISYALYNSAMSTNEMPHLFQVLICLQKRGTILNTWLS